MKRSRNSASDNRRGDRAALVLAFAWGLCEATFFFVVPDVLLSFFGMRDIRAAVWASLAALAGALLGGALMFEIARRAPQDSSDFLVRLPGIDAELVAGVRSQVGEQGLSALAHGVVRGRPYKIYAVECGAASTSFAAFLLVSVPVRASRFFASALLARLVTAALSRWTRRRRAVEVGLWASFWIAFYAWYFSVFGW